MPPKTKMTREEVAAELAEKEIKVINPAKKFHDESNADLTRAPKDYSPLKTPSPDLTKIYGGNRDFEF